MTDETGENLNKQPEKQAIPIHQEDKSLGKEEDEIVKNIRTDNDPDVVLRNIGGGEFPIYGGDELEPVADWTESAKGVEERFNKILNIIHDVSEQQGSRVDLDGWRMYVWDATKVSPEQLVSPILLGQKFPTEDTSFTETVFAKDENGDKVPFFDVERTARVVKFPEEGEAEYEPMPHAEINFYSNLSEKPDGKKRGEIQIKDNYRLVGRSPVEEIDLPVVVDSEGQVTLELDRIEDKDPYSWQELNRGIGDIANGEYHVRIFGNKSDTIMGRPDTDGRDRMKPVVLFSPRQKENT